MEKNRICYCFGYFEEDIIRDVLENKGTSTILEKIANEKKRGGCSCSNTHPLKR
jgi:hypothetical protein